MEPNRHVIKVGDKYMGFGEFPTIRLVPLPLAIRMDLKEARTWLHDDRMNGLMEGCSNGTIARIVRIKTSGKVVL